MTRIYVEENKKYPVYRPRVIDPALLAEHPSAGIDVEDGLLAEYAAAEQQWYAVQDKLASVAEELEQRRKGQ